MIIAKVVGNLWATRKHPHLKNYRLLIVQRLKAEDLSPDGEPIVAVCNEIDAGIGDIVLVLDEGSSARQILNDKEAPIRTVVVGIVDEIFVNSILNKIN